MFKEFFSPAARVAEHMDYGLQFGTTIFGAFVITLTCIVKLMVHVLFLNLARNCSFKLQNVAHVSPVQVCESNME